MIRKTFLVITALVIATLTSQAASAQIFPQLTITPDPLDFGSVRAGTTTDAMTVTVTADQGSLPAYIFGTTLGDSVNFTITNDGCEDAVLSAGDSCTVDITFSPPQTGHYFTSLSVISISQSVLDHSVVEGLGTAPKVTLSASSIAFGDQTVGKSSLAHEIAMVNSGNETLSITSIVATDNFAVTDDCGDSLEEDASCTLNITFTPPSADEFTGTVTITDDASDSPQVISLSGTGIVPGQPDASLSRHEIDFANQLVGTTSGAEEVTLKNTGTVILNITSITASANFAITDDCGATLAVDATCTLSITFTPNAAASFSGTITVTDDASDSPQTISLTGVGIQTEGPQATLSAEALDFGQQTVDTTSDAQQVTVTNSGDSTLSITDVEIGGNEPNQFSDSDNCHGSTLSPNETCDVSISFHPDDVQTFTAIVTITSNASGSPQTITLSGSGIASSSGGGCSIVAGAGEAMGFAPLGLILALIAIRRRKRQ